MFCSLTVRSFCFSDVYLYNLLVFVLKMVLKTRKHAFETLKYDNQCIKTDKITIFVTKP